MRPMRARSTLLSCLAALLAASASHSGAQGPSVTVVTAADAPPLERLAATELSALLKTLFQAEVAMAPATASGGAGHRILLGSSASLPAVGAALPAALGEQGHVVKSTPEGLVIGGGSPVATLWAVYEYGYANGMRYLTSGDFPPLEKPAFTLEGYDLVRTPRQAVRAWRIAPGGPASQAAWSRAALETLLRQLAKLKFNAVILPESESLPGFEPIDVTGDIAGRAAFGGARELKNPDVSDDPDMNDRWIAGIRTEADRLGMTIDPVDRALLDLPLGRPKGGLLPETVALPVLPGAASAGFAVSASLVGDINPQLHYLSRVAWDAAVTPESALRDLATPICGEGVAEPLGLGFGAVAEASALIERNDPGFAVPDAAMFMKHYRSAEPAPAWWAEAKGLYAKGMNEMYRANTRARDGARPWILYHAKRYTFALHYLTAVESARAAGIARAAKDEAAWEEQLALAIEAMHNALGIYSEVAADPSDRGAIALLNAYGYRPLLEALDELP